MMSAIRKAGVMACCATLGVLVTGCHIDMWVQPKVKANQENEFFRDGMGNRPPVAHTVARGQLHLDDAFYKGMTQVGPKVTDMKLVEEFPFKVTKEVLQRGQERFKVYCTPCHGQLGNGKGMIAQRGLALRRQPGNFHTDRLRKMPIGHFYDVITNGYGVMYSYATRVTPEDRWKIVAYIRVLQLSQNPDASLLSDKDKEQIEHPKPESKGESE